MMRVCSEKFFYDGEKDDDNDRRSSIADQFEDAGDNLDFF